MEKRHHYNVRVNWTGNRGEGTVDYKGYDRSHQISVPGKQTIEASSDPSFLGDRTKYNPEELFLASLSTCHMLWYLHLCADNGIVVTEYIDHAIGEMIQDDHGGRFTEVILKPQVTITDSSKIAQANSLHYQANSHCYIANSCNFPVLHEPTCLIKK